MWSSISPSVTQKWKHKNPSFDLFKNTIERLQYCSNGIHVTDSDSSTYEEATKQQAWKDGIWKVFLSYQRKLVITFKRIYEIILCVDIKSCLKLS